MFLVSRNRNNILIWSWNNSEDKGFDTLHKIRPGTIILEMCSLISSVQYRAIKDNNLTTDGHFIVEFTRKPYALLPLQH